MCKQKNLKRTKEKVVFEYVSALAFYLILKIIYIFIYLFDCVVGAIACVLMRLYP